MQGHPVIGVTGGVGCGKSEVGRILSGLGVEVKDADALVHEELRAGSPAVARIAGCFGPGYVKPDGSLDRARLADLVFQDARARSMLEEIVHPPVLEQFRAWMSIRRREGPGAGIIPLLYEVNFTTGWNEIWCVSAEPELARQRCLARGWTEAQWTARQAAQWPLREKEKRADVVVHNNGSRAALAATVRQAWESVRIRSA